MIERDRSSGPNRDRLEHVTRGLAAILRAPDDDAHYGEREAFTDDLRSVAEALAGAVRGG